MKIVLSGIVGSTAYGLAGEHSDIDRLAVYAEPAASFHGLDLPIDRKATIVHRAPNPDFTLHEARKFAMLCLGGNPTLTELLWLPTELYEGVTEAGTDLIRIRTAFSSAKRVRDAYLGYASSQLHLLLKTGQFQSKMRSRAAKHARHLLRLLDQGVEFYTTGLLPIRVANPQRYFDFGDRVAADPSQARVELAAAEEKFARVKSPLPPEPDRDRVDAWLRFLRAAYPA